jgi:uncharacterized protein (DUF362 family)/Pyruvate/2-oxoacid:ferredoxin oxidoreductase delta subunit
VRCEEYEPDKVLPAIKRGIGLLGDLSSIVKPGSRVLLKPNLVCARRPEEGVDTHPEVVRAVARLVKEAGGLIWLGDSPSGYVDIDEVYEISGMRKIADDEGLELVKFDSSRDVDGFPLSRHALDADVIISIPKFRTHAITTFTAGVKNMFGTVIGLSKAMCHVKAPKKEEFAKLIAMVYAHMRPDLTVLDAIVSMEGDGPVSGMLRRSNFIMISQDAVALDAVLAKIIGLEPLDLAVTRACAEEGLGEADFSEIEIVGDDPNAFTLSDFKLPEKRLLRIFRRHLINVLESLMKFRPVIDNERCRRCNTCRLSCPVSAITIGERRCAIDYKKCVRCLCCNEVCPHQAVSVKRNIFAKMVIG